MSIKIVSPRAELSVLRAITSKNKIIAGTVLQGVDESYFDSPESKEIFTVMKNHMARTGESPTYKLLLEDPELSTDARSFFRDSEATITTPEEAVKAVKILNKYRQTRGLYELAADIDRKMQAGKLDIDAALEQASNVVSSLRANKSKKDAFLHFGKSNNSLGFIKDLIYSEDNDDVIPTGIPVFDEQSGGFMRGGLVTLGASSGGGKSVLANQLAKNMAELGYKVLLVPLEMTRLEMSGRLTANVAKMDVTRVLQKRLASGEKDLAFAKMKRWMHKVKLAGGRLTYFDPGEDLDLEEIFAASNSYDCDVVIIDYISLLKGVDGDDAWQKLGAAARTAKVNAKATNRVNVLLCQVSEDGKIRYARSISEHSNSSWVWVTDKNERAKPIGRIRVEQPKSRNSRAFPFEIGIEWAFMRVVSVENQSEVGEVAEPTNTKGSRGVTEKEKPRRNLADV